jgi:hypothetical protein
MFPYEEIPKIPFNDRIVPHNMPKEIWITDTTFRDGQQSRAPYTADQILHIYDELHRLGGPKGLIRQSEFFLYSKKDREAVDRCLNRGYDYPEVTSWIRASEEDFKLVKEIGMKETGILVSCSDYHIYNKMGLTRATALDKYLGVVKEILSLGIVGFMMKATNSLVQIAANATLRNYGGDIYVGAMTVINSIREVLTLPITGVTSGAQPVIGYNYGAGNRQELTSLLRHSVILLLTLGGVMTFVSEVSAGPAARLFVGYDPEL